eukprot:TRINITY_DN10209_c0_g1_i1.p1 TRINITY_DN10209_c0_g1~~TRINITY_DN10209_c0_g1_i1.p1  ORF type:complete len:337 (-),score=58.67 TRINITY_DN10209_c0_g1_i1:496-1506(-)
MSEQRKRVEEVSEVVAISSPVPAHASPARVPPRKKRKRVRDEGLLIRLVEAAACCVGYIGFFAGPVCVVVALMLIGGLAFKHVTMVVPYHCPDGPFSPCALAHVAFSAWWVFNMVFNYYYGISTSPGYGSDAPEDPIESVSGRVRFCERCDRWKPERSHHCQICDKCVLRMDHHCPWMANCIGHRNQKFFVLFLFYVSTGCLYLSAMCLSPFLNARSRFQRTASGSVLVIPPGTISFMFILGLSIGISVGLMLLWHIYLVASAQTTIEFYNNRVTASHLRETGVTFRNPHDHGLHKNFDNVFGPNSLWWRWLLPNSQPCNGNGWEWRPRTTGPQQV